MTKIFRGCRYEVNLYSPGKGLWSRHASIDAARRSYREAVNNRRGDHSAGTLVELSDVDGGSIQILGREVVLSISDGVSGFTIALCQECGRDAANAIGFMCIREGGWSKIEPKKRASKGAPR